MGRQDEAIAAYKEAIRLQPRYAAAHYNLAIALCKKGIIRPSPDFSDLVPFPLMRVAKRINQHMREIVILWRWINYGLPILDSADRRESRFYLQSLSRTSETGTTAELSMQSFRNS